MRTAENKEDGICKASQHELPRSKQQNMILFSYSQVKGVWFFGGGVFAESMAGNQMQEASTLFGSLWAAETKKMLNRCSTD